MGVLPPYDESMIWSFIISHKGDLGNDLMIVYAITSHHVHFWERDPLVYQIVALKDGRVVVARNLQSHANGKPVNCCLQIEQR